MCFDEEKLEDICKKWEQSPENFWIGLSLKVGCQNLRQQGTHAFKSMPIEN